MILYTINNAYPDRNWNFTLTLSSLSLIPAVHTHAITVITDLDLDNWSDLEHQHSMVQDLYATEQYAGDEEHSVSVTCSNNATLSVENGTTVSFTYVSPATGNVTGIINHNALGDMLIKPYVDYAESSVGTGVCYLTIEENHYD